MGKNYKGLTFPEELLEEIDQIIKDKKLGYKSRAEFVKTAIRSLLKKTIKDIIERENLNEYLKTLDKKYLDK